MIVCNTMFEKEDSKLISYESGTDVSTVDYILCRACDRSMIRDVKILPNEICVPKHKLLVMDMKIKDVKKVSRQFGPKLKIWRLQNEQIKDEFAGVVNEALKNKKVETEVNGCWQSMRDSMIHAAEKVCGWTKGCPRHKETWWWNEEVEQAINEKKKRYQIWRKTRSADTLEAYRQSKKQTKRVVAVSKHEKSQEIASDLDRKETE